MIKAILFDCGGVMVRPTTGDWLLAPAHAGILGDDFIANHLESFRRARGKYADMIPDANRIDTDAEECAMFEAFYAPCFADMGMPLSPENLTRLARAQVYDDDRYVFFDDVLPYFAAWRERYKLGIVSDAPPSTRRILRTAGVMALMDGATFSCDLGVLKPDPRMHQSALDQLGVRAADAVFVDDFPSKMRGAVEMGIRCVQMRRPMPTLFKLPAVWDGPVAHDFAELDAMLAAM